MHRQATREEVEEPELKLMLIWDAGIIDSGFIHYATMPTPTYIFKTHNAT